MTLHNPYSRSMKTDMEDKRRYTIRDSHRNQSFVGILKKDPASYAWTWSGYINFENGHEVTFTSQRSFKTHVEAEEYLRQFARACIENRLGATERF